MRKLHAAAAVGLLLGLLTLSAVSAETVETRDGQRFKGTVVSETATHLTLESSYGTLRIAKRDVVRRSGETHKLRLADGSVVIGQIVRQSKTEVILKTAHGALTIPASSIRWIDDELSPAAKAIRGDPQQVRQLHTQASRLHNQKQYAQAIAVYRQLLALAPDDATALYNVACGYSLLNEREDAVDYLERAVLAGFSNFQHIRSDSDLDNLRTESGYLRILAEETTFLRKAAAQKTVRLRRELTSRGTTGKYRLYVDKQRNFIWLHAKTDAKFARIRKQMERYAEIQWRDLFRNKVTEPLHIVLLTRADGPAMLDPGIGGFFRPSTNTLICGDMLSFKMTRSSVTIHEFTHALHFADQSKRKQPHPIWLVEGMGSLFESSSVVKGKLVPRHSARLTGVQRALRRNGTIPWRRMMQMRQPSFMADASLAYAQSRYMLLYMYEQGALKRFYDDYTTKANFQGDKSAQESFEVVFGKPIDEVEADWKVWLAKQAVPPMPFIGIRSEPHKDGGRIVNVVAGSGAAAAKLTVGDVIQSVGGFQVRGPDDVIEALSTREVGDVVEFLVLRDGAPVRVQVTLGKRQ